MSAWVWIEAAQCLKSRMVMANDAHYRERLEQKALGHNSKAVHHAYSKHAEVTVPSLHDWEKQWKKSPQGIAKPAVVQVDFRSDEIDARSRVSEIMGFPANVAGR